MFASGCGHTVRWRMLRGASVLLTLAFMLISAQLTHAATPQPQAGWQSYTNPVLGYSLSYPLTWHRLNADPRLAQEFVNYNERTAPMEFPEHGSYTKVEVYIFQKPTTQNLTAWMKEKVDRLPGPGPFILPDKTTQEQIAGMPAIVQTRNARAPRSTNEYLDAGPAVFIINMFASEQGELATARQIVNSFRITGKLDLAHATMPAGPAPKPRPTCPSSPTGMQPLCTYGWPGLSLPLQVDYAWSNMPSLAMNGGGVNSWFDHVTPTGTDGSLTRYDGQVLSNSGGCSSGWSCYDGHNGIDFSTNGMTGIPVYASDTGTVTTQNQGSGSGGLCIVVQSSGKANLSTQDCHLSSYVVTSGTVYSGQLIAYSGNTGNTSGPHVHFSSWDTAVSGWAAVDPFGWSGGGSDPWGYDSNYGYMWATNPPSFIGPTIYTVSASLNAGWYTGYTDGYGVSYAWTYTNNYSSPQQVATWNAPTTTCTAAEVWIPWGNATANPAKYKINFSNAGSVTVNVDQNDNTSWYTIRFDLNYGTFITSIVMGDNTGTSGQQIAASKMWFSC
jgi:murein DD-endopeptidase MepM/ murein hydrolase activator NlpD